MFDSAKNDMYSEELRICGELLKMLDRIVDNEELERLDNDERIELSARQRKGDYNKMAPWINMKYSNLRKKVYINSMSDYLNKSRGKYSTLVFSFNYNAQIRDYLGDDNFLKGDSPESAALKIPVIKRKLELYSNKLNVQIGLYEIKRGK